MYLAIDQHSKQITVCVRNAEGDTVLRRQVSTRLEKIKLVFDQLTAMDLDFMAILEVCGFNDWLLAEQGKWNCREIVLIELSGPIKMTSAKKKQSTHHRVTTPSARHSPVYSSDASGHV